jgi:hypothetical protein
MRGSLSTVVRVCSAVVMCGAAALVSSRNVQAKQDACYIFCHGACYATCNLDGRECGGVTAGGTYPSCECAYVCQS